jgi:hypothetical protein
MSKTIIFQLKKGKYSIWNTNLVKQSFVEFGMHLSVLKQPCIVNAEAQRFAEKKEYFADFFPTDFRRY